MRVNASRGFTSSELLIVVAMIGICVGVLWGFRAVLAGNFYVTNDSALQCVQFVDRTQKSVVKITRGVFDSTLVITEDASGHRTVFRLDTNILLDAECERPDATEP